MSFKTVPQMFQHLVNERPTLKTFYTKTDNGWEGVELTELQKLVEDFVDIHYVPEPFIKRKRDRKFKDERKETKNNSFH